MNNVKIMLKYLQGSDILKNRFNNTLKKIYKIDIKNIIYISCTNILFFSIFELCRFYIPKILNLHLQLNLKIDSISIYSCILSLILPLAIMIIEKIGNKQDYIIAETYLNTTKIFPIVIYFCTNLFILEVTDDQYYYIFTTFISTIFIIYMYYKSFKLLSNLRYEKEKISLTRNEIVDSDLKDQIKHFDTSNLINKYLKYGIFIAKYDYFNTKDYEKINIYPSRNLMKIEQYNYRQLEKIVKKLKVINKDYINNNLIDKLDTNEVLKQETKLKIAIELLSIGSATQRERSFITIYYDKNFKKEAEAISSLLNNKIYILSEINNHFYIKVNYENIQIECVKSIESFSSVLFRNSLGKYLDIYKNYIDGIRNNIGDYTYKIAYDQTHSFYSYKAYDILELISHDIYDYSQIILKHQNEQLMSELVGFVYEMILYSYTKKELLSIQYLHNIYSHLNTQSLKLKDDSIPYHRIKLEIFELITIVEYDMNLNNADFNKDILLICNKTISNILFYLSNHNNKYFYQYLRKVFDFMDNIKDKIEQLKYSNNQNEMYLLQKYEEIYENYNCNIFATIAYIVKKWEKGNSKIEKLLKVYENYEENELVNVLLKTIEMDYNDKTYSWEMMEDRDFDESDGVFTVNTNFYLIHLFCLLINKKKNPNLPLSYPLSTHAEILINEFNKMKNIDMVEKVNKLVIDVEKEEKDYIRNTPIDSNKIEKFKANFISNYNKNSQLSKIFSASKNLIYVKKVKNGENYLGINNIVDKTYFLTNMPHDRTIIWSNFEDSYADSFIRAEEKKYSKLLDENAILNNMNLISYFKQHKLNADNYIIFADYTIIYNTFNRENLSYTIPENYKTFDSDARTYFKYNDKYIPIYQLDGLNEEFIYLIKVNKIGKIKKLENSFNIEIKDFFNNKNLIDDYMNAEVSGLNLNSEERRQHLLECVNISINEYIKIEDDKMEAIKFKN